MNSRYLSGRTAILAAAVCFVVGSSACEVPEDPDPLPDPLPEADLDEISIQEIKTNGQGCPAEDPYTVQTVISEDKKSFVIIFRDMELTNPPGPNVKNLSCQAAVSLHIPSGFQVALATVNTRGYAYLDEGIDAKETSSYFFAGVPVGAYPHTLIEGPHDDFYEFSDNIPLVSLVWSPCGASAIFGINTTLNLNANDNPDGQAIFGTNTVDGVFRTMDLFWQIRAC